MGNVGINNVGTESVIQTRQAGRTQCLAGVSQEGLTRGILARHSCLHLAWLFAFQSCARNMLPFAGCLVSSYSRNLFSLQLHESSHSLSNTQPLKWNPIINTGYKKLNNITIKFGTKYKPTRHNVVNNNFTVLLFILVSHLLNKIHVVFDAFDSSCCSYVHKKFKKQQKFIF